MDGDLDVVSVRLVDDGDDVVIGDSLDTHNIHLLQRRIAISFFSNFSESRREFTRAVRLEGVLGPHSRPP